MAVMKAANQINECFKDFKLLQANELTFLLSLDEALSKQSNSIKSSLESLDDIKKLPETKKRMHVIGKWKRKTLRNPIKLFINICERLVELSYIFKSSLNNIQKPSSDVVKNWFKINEKLEKWSRVLLQHPSAELQETECHIPIPNHFKKIIKVLPTTFKIIEEIFLEMGQSFRRQREKCFRIEKDEYNAIEEIKSDLEDEISITADFIYSLYHDLTKQIKSMMGENSELEERIIQIRKEQLNFERGINFVKQKLSSHSEDTVSRLATLEKDSNYYKESIRRIEAQLMKESASVQNHYCSLKRIEDELGKKAKRDEEYRESTRKMIADISQKMNNLISEMDVKGRANQHKIEEFRVSLEKEREARELLKNEMEKDKKDYMDSINNLRTQLDDLKPQMEFKSRQRRQSYSASSVISYKITDQVDSRAFPTIAKHIGYSNMNKVALELGVDPKVLEEVKRSTDKSSDEKIYFLLNEWKELVSSEATWKKFFKTLKKFDLNDTHDQIYQSYEFTK